MSLPGIFCLEGEWGKNLRSRLSVEPQLTMLREAGECGPVIHRDVATRTDFDYYLETWLGRGYSAYTVGYLAFHGEREILSFNKKDEVTLDELETSMESRALGRTLYLGSCGVLAGETAQHHERLRGFCRATGLKALVGYTKEVEWLESAAFDFLLLPELVQSSLANRVHPRLVRKYGTLVNKLGLRIVTGTAVHSWKAKDSGAS